MIFVVFGILSFVYLIYRFCLRKSIASDLRNKFVIRHFLYYVSYLLIQMPYYLFSLFYIFRDLKQIDNYYRFYKITILIHLSLGFIMNLIRAYETNFYKHVFFCFKNKEKNNKLTSQSPEENENENKKNEGEITEGYLDPDQPLTVMIKNTLNLEFICCVLFGLSTIYKKSNVSKRKNTEENSNIYLIDSSSIIKKSQISISSKKKEIIK